MNFKTIIGGCIALIGGLLVTSCEDDVVSLDSESTGISHLGGGGDFIVVNKTENDTLFVEGAISIAHPQILLSHVSDEIFIKFLPIESYKDYTFETTYTFPDGTKIDNLQEYAFVVNDEKTGTITLRAESSGSKTTSSEKGHKEVQSWFITAYGSFRLIVVE